MVGGAHFTQPGVDDNGQRSHGAGTNRSSEHCTTDIDAFQASDDFQPLSSPTAKRLREDKEAREYITFRSTTEGSDKQQAKVLVRPQSSGNETIPPGLSKPPKLVKAIREAGQPVPGPIFAPKSLVDAVQCSVELSMQQPYDTDFTGIAKAALLQSQTTANDNATSRAVSACDQQCTTLPPTEPPEPPEKHVSHETGLSVAPDLPVKNLVEILKGESKSLPDDAPNDVRDPSTLGDDERPTSDPVEPKSDNHDEIHAEGIEFSSAFLTQEELFSHSADGEHGVSTVHEVDKVSRSGSLPAPHKRRHQSRSSVMSFPGAPAKVIKHNEQVRQRGARFGNSLKLALPDTFTAEEIANIWRCRYIKSESAFKNAEEATMVARATTKNTMHRIVELLEEKEDLQKHVSELEQRHVQAREQNLTLLQEFEMFREKYYKLKTFAKKFNKELHDLRTGFADQRQSIDDAQAFGRKYRDSVTEVEIVANKVQDDLQKQKVNIDRVRIDLQNFSNTTNRLQQTVQDKNNALYREQLRNRQLGEYVVKRDASQKASESANYEHARSLVTWIRNISDKLDQTDSIGSAFEIKRKVEECLTIVKALSTIDVATQQSLNGVVWHIAQVHSDLITRTTNFDQSLKDLSDRQNEDTGATTILQTPLNETLSLVRALKPQVDHATNLEVERARLCGELDMQKALLAQSNDRLTQNDITIRQAVSAQAEMDKQKQQKQQQVSDAESQLRIKYNSVSSNFAVATQQLNSAQKKIQQLEHDLQRDQSRLAKEQLAHQQSEEAASKRVAEINSSYEQKLTDQQESARQTVDGLKSTAAHLEARLNTAIQEIERQKELISQSQSKFSELEGINKQLSKDKDQNMAQILKDQSELEDLRQKAVELVTTANDLETCRAEIQRLTPFESKAAKLNSDLANLEEGVTVADESIQNLRRELETSMTRADLVPGLEHAVAEYKKAEHCLTVKLTHAEHRAKDFDELQKNLEAQETSNSTLTAEMEKLRPLIEELRTTRENNDRTAQELIQVKDDLATAQKQIESHSDFAAQLHAKDGQIASLKVQLNTATEAQSHVAVVKQESQRKDLQIAELKEEVVRLKRESQILDPVNSRIQIDASLLQPLAAPIPNQICLDESGREQRALNTAGQDYVVPESQDRSHMVSAEEELPRRRVADRSAPKKPQRPVLSGEHRESGDSQNFSQRTDVVPDSQVNRTPTRRVFEDINSDSPLTDLSDLVQGEDALKPVVEVERHVEVQYAMPIKSKQQQHPFRRTTTDLGTIRPSSSSSNMDLFRSHEYDLGTQRLENTFHRHAEDAVRGTVAPREVGLHSPQSGQSNQQIVNPFCIGESSAHGVDSQSQEAARSPIQSDVGRHHANSAIKRIAESVSQVSSQEHTSKRRRRDVDNMKVREPNLVGAPQTKARTPTPSQRGGSVIGSDAPGPRTTQRAAKSGKRAAKGTKYGQRFSH